MPNTNRKIGWALTFVCATLLVIGVGVNEKSLFKPIPTTVRTQVTEQGAGPGAGTYTITRETKTDKPNPFDRPVKAGIIIVWAIAYIGLLSTLVRNIMVRILLLLLSIPLLFYFLLAASFAKNFTG
ncbi:MAG TPA: hypothetical protein VF466_04305 [Candidatus Saccharimonadales bacterium]